jgi:hypothetical protein
MLDAIITALCQFLFVAIMLWCMAVGFGFVVTWKLAMGIWAAIKLVKFTIGKNN